MNISHKGMMAEGGTVHEQSEPLETTLLESTTIKTYDSVHSDNGMDSKIDATHPAAGHLCSGSLVPRFIYQEDGQHWTLEERKYALIERTSRALVPDAKDLAVLRAIESALCAKEMLRIYQENKHEKGILQQVDQLPVQDALWVIGTFENVCFESEDLLRIMCVEEVHGRHRTVLQTNSAFSRDVSYKSQLIQLLCSACVKPFVKSPRKPRFLQLKAPPKLDDDLSFNLNCLGIHIFSPQVRDTDITHAQSIISDKFWFRSCNECGRRGEAAMFSSCPDCGAVLFCDTYCQHSSDHSRWCPYFKVFMGFEEALGAFPFSFADETTSRLYHVFKHRDFLKRYKIYNKGIWRRECKLLIGSLLKIGYGDMDWPSVEPYGLSKEDCMLKQLPEKSPPQLAEPLKDWADYYDYRGFEQDSPIAGVLHYALTLYSIITTHLPQKYPSVFQRMIREQFLCVHVIGAAKEADMWHTFLECARLIRPINLHICFIGNEISKKSHEKFITEENLFVTYFSGLYHKLTSRLIVPEGNIAVCFNAGLGAYESYKPTVQQLMSSGVPIFCTDYCLASYEQSRKSVRVQKLGKLSEPTVNPFRSPFRMVYTDMDLPRYSNAAVFTVLPYSPAESPQAFVRESFLKKHTKLDCVSEVYKLSLLPADL